MPPSHYVAVDWCFLDMLVSLPNQARPLGSLFMQVNAKATRCAPVQTLQSANTANSPGSYYWATRSFPSWCERKCPCQPQSLGAMTVDQHAAVAWPMGRNL